MFSRASKGTVRPIELGRRLIREMDENRSVDVRGRRIVPNHFTFWLSPADHASFADIDDALVSELREAAREYARDEGYHFMGDIDVELDIDNGLKTGRFALVSQMREPVTPAGSGTGSLLMPTGERVHIGSTPVSMGRTNECTIVLPDLNVSRRHAEVRTVVGGYVVVDLGSTNGTKVNGSRLTGEHALRDGDTISLGTTHIRFEAH